MTMFFRRKCDQICINCLRCDHGFPITITILLLRDSENSYNRIRPKIRRT